MKKSILIASLLILAILIGCINQVPEGLIIKDKEIPGCTPDIAINTVKWESDKLIVSGEVHNKCGKDSIDFSIKGQYYAKDGKELGINRVIIKEVKDKEKKSFTISFLDPDKKVSRYELSIDRIYWKQ
ncbi:MAG: hypothetical protein APG12_01132 [Candidatus Methanofastidiosum methylothiophilum]|uniref:Lipoprotein n=1 Tax=Candidatus Methanofastidiosum methylothiophilum TaxID=1705564 RepID=A0A150IQM6_9EURY|nr:MAG: hypothetical protein APG10_01133 [Candidatus Methanofastidiosum methylthiophilus]KYC47172.1 MAG: hypothetical protein APG11_01381 [Candidatus Methanofastidiosum methylthiophilus]KYC49958.1 MAG: hypothetical protein APG12_01132 [Candidatus Methanofastidiosum methylthiophilus]